MANTFTCLRYHVVFSTKHREPWIRPPIEGRLRAYLGGIARQNGMNALLIGGVDDHVHMLLGLPPTLAVSDALKQIKGGSSGWIRENLPVCRGFGWQDGYGAFTVSKSQVPEVEEYLRGQREHHQVRTSQEEYRALLDRHEIEYEERYLWG
jgi:REP element-mobilizing transposase RayT